MFYDQLLLVCSKKNIKITNVVSELSLSSGNLSKWKNGTVPSGDILLKLADYLDISVDYLLGRTDKPDSHKN